MDAFEMSWNLLRKAWYDSVDDRHREQPFDRPDDFPPYTPKADKMAAARLHSQAMRQDNEPTGTPFDDYDEVPQDEFANMPRDKLVAMVRRMMQEKEM